MTNRRRRLLIWWAAATCLWFGFWLLALSVDPAITRCFPRADPSDTAWCYSQWHDWPTPLAQLAGFPFVVLLIGLAITRLLRGSGSSD
ncbi:MAG: hypothetical protein U1E21_09970 [Reyranellaceae bacterium]